MSEVYLDHAATTDIRPSVIEAMTRVMRDTGNPSSLHAAGRRARKAVEQAREQIAEATGAHPIEVIFTGGATEADNLAISGGLHARRAHDAALRALAVSPTEHPAVHDTARFLQQQEDVVLHWLQIDDAGVVDAGALSELLQAEPVALAAVMWANNEVGTINDIPAIAGICNSAGVPLHVDAVQALGRLPIRFAEAAMSSLALSAHKIGGPQGVGALLATRSFTPVPTSHGGGQERRVRSGTLDVAGIVGFSVAISEAEAERAAEAERLSRLRERITQAAAAISGVEVNGHPHYAPAQTHPGIVSLHTAGADADALLMLLDDAGIAISTGSACTSGVSEPSHVILAMSGDERRAKQSIRISLGRSTTPQDVDLLLQALPDAIERARRASGVRR